MTNQPRPQPKSEKPWIRSYPADIKWDSDVPVSTLVADFDEAVQKYAGRTWLSFFGQKLTFGEVGVMVDHFAKGLQEQGIGKGSTVGICLPNTPYYVIAYFGALKAGATVANFNPTYTETELEYQIKDSKTDIMITTNVSSIYPNVEKMLDRTPLKKIVVGDLDAALPFIKRNGVRLINSIVDLAGVFGEAAGKKASVWRDKKGVPGLSRVKRHGGKVVSFKKLLKNDGKPAAVTVTADEVAVLQYTGGTTGVPKAAMLTHANLSANVHQAHTWFTGGKEPASQEKILAVLPFFHVFSMTTLMNFSLKSGSELHMIPKPDMKQMLEIIQDEGITIFAGVPKVYKGMLEYKGVEKYDLSSLKFGLSGAAALSDDTRAGIKKLVGIDLTEGYGLSETSPLAIANPINGLKKQGSIGLPVPGTEIKFTDVEFPDREVAIKMEGEICLKGPQIMAGYWQRPDETAKVMDKDGFFHTGDVGYMDEDGYVFIVDRIKDMINVNGYKAFSRKVEDAIRLHDAVSEVIVIGVPNDRSGEAVKAFVQLKPGKTLKAEELHEFLKDKLVSYCLPRASMIEFRDSLPATMIGKPDKKALKDEEKAKREAKKKPQGPAA